MRIPHLATVIGPERVIAVVRADESMAAIEITKAALAGGIRIVEVTCTVPDAAAVVADLAAGTNATDAVIGAGTVLHAADAEAMLHAGAQFLVSPFLVRDVLAVGAQAGVPVLPGVFTPGEASAAAELGSPVVKLFPAEVLGPGFARALRTVLTGLDVVPTGGVTADNAPHWLAAGACAVGVGGALTSAYSRDGPDGVTAVARRVRRACHVREVSVSSSEEGRP